MVKSGSNIRQTLDIGTNCQISLIYVGIQIIICMKQVDNQGVYHFVDKLLCLYSDKSQSLIVIMGED